MKSGHGKYPQNMKLKRILIIDDVITLWLLLADRRGLVSLAGGSRMSITLCSRDSGLQQQVDVYKKAVLLIISHSKPVAILVYCL